MFVALVPWWVPLCVVGGLMFVVFMAAAIHVFIDERREKKKRR